MKLFGSLSPGKKKALIGMALLALLAITAWQVLKPEPENYISVRVKKGKFLVAVNTTGELKAKNSIEIRGPQSAQQVGIWQMKISNLVEEGKYVKPGDFVADLDKSEIMAKVKDIELSIQKRESELTSSKLDSSLNLSSARDELENLKFSLEEKKIAKEQSIYEAPAIKRQAEIDYERTKRNYEQSIKNYTTKVKQAIAKLSSVGADLSKEKQKFDMLMQTMGQFTITAPAQGMVIYARDWNGDKTVVGSTISAWNPVVATLPDLSSMESVTYVNETDIQKIRTGQKVRIGLDANPNKKLSGEIIKIATIGEEKKNSDSKVFEVTIRVNERDTTLLPSMTTSNEIMIETLSNVCYIPIEALHSEQSKSGKVMFVYKKNGSRITKQEVVTGTMNENDIIILRGLGEQDEVLLSVPKSTKDITLARLKGKK